MCVYAQEATVAFHKLSPAQFNTGWVLCQLGRAYYEMVDYPAAANVFEFARQADRHRLEVCGHPPWTSSIGQVLPAITASMLQLTSVQQQNGSQALVVSV